MPEAEELQQITASLWAWQVYDPAIKSDLFSTALLAAGLLFLVDPVRLASPFWKELTADRRLGGILVTNVNHLRNAAALARRERIPVLAAEPVTRQLAAVETKILDHGSQVAPNLTAIAIEGAAEGELAFHSADDDGTVVTGDSLIHLEPYGFALLPAKYCVDQKAMWRSLRQLLDYQFERLFFAHGTPLISSARSRLEMLLE
jgi:glyoxylase-like metal-dependent hydrolase (beta-lactamase superfamily II)